MATARDVWRHHPSDDEIADVLSNREVAALGTLNADGSVHLTYVLFLLQDARVYVETSSVTRKASNVAARPTAGVLVQGRASSGRNLMVSGEGDARVIRGSRGPGSQPSRSLEVRRRGGAGARGPIAYENAWLPD
jgi:hypothetical protein